MAKTGCFVSVITAEEVRIEGNVAYEDDSMIILEKVTCDGTEGRKKNQASEIAACNRVDGCVQIRHKDYKDMELVFPPHKIRLETEFPPLSRTHVHIRNPMPRQGNP